MFYTIYKIINKINDRVYIGKHKTENLDDGYMGSGKLLKRAIAKYGPENFIKEILHQCSSEQEMNDKEAEIVTEEFCKGHVYNICSGGQGGFSYINRNSLNWTLEKNERISGFRNATLEQRAQRSIKAKETFARLVKEGKRKYNTPVPRLKGSTLTEEHKEKIRRAQKGRIPWNKGITGYKKKSVSITIMPV